MSSKFNSERKKKRGMNSKAQQQLGFVAKKKGERKYYELIKGKKGLVRFELIAESRVRV